MYFVILTLLLNGCSIGNEKLIRREIKQGDIRIKWFLYSYIGNVSPDIIVVEKGGKEVEIFRAYSVVTDVYINKHSITLRLVKGFNSEAVLTKSLIKSIFEYAIIYDSTAEISELKYRPDTF